jgi:DNA-binding MurR/RpiR family transcriptional regulator
MLTSAAVLESGDVAVGISHSGTTAETIDALAEARKRGAITVGLTNFPRSPIAEVADHVLTTAARETTFRSGATASRLAQLTVIDCVFVGVAQRTFKPTRQALEDTYEAVRGRRVRQERKRR